MAATDRSVEIPLIDGHTHCFSPEVAEVLVDVMEKCKLRAFNVCGIVCRGGESIIQNHLALTLKLRHPGKVYACGGLRYKLPAQTKANFDPLGQAKRLIELGFDGIKMIEGKPTAYEFLGIAMNDPVYDEYYGWLEEKQVPVVFHVADPETFWDRSKIPPHFLEMGWCYDDGTYPTKEQLYSEVDDVLERFPRLRLIFAHFYFLSGDADRADRFLERWENVSFDITPGMEMYGNFSRDPGRWKDFFTKHRERIVFGTDNICSVDEGERNEAVAKIRNMRRFLETTDEFTFGRYDVKGLGLDEAVLAKIYHENFGRYFGDAPREVDRQKATDFCRQLRRDALEIPEGDALLAAIDDMCAELQGRPG